MFPMARPSAQFVFAVVLLLLGGGVANLDPEKQRRIDEFALSLIRDCDEHDIAGLNLAVVQGGAVLYTTGYGVRNLESREPVTADTVYSIASVSKHFTATLLGQVLQNHGYSWSTTVRSLMADLGVDYYFRDPLRSNSSTLRDLASHSTGVLGSDYIWLQEMTREDQVSRFRFLENVAEPRTSFLYNNLFFVLLGHIAELMEGRTWEELVQTEVFDKVGMPNSSFIYTTDATSAQLATPYIRAPTELREIDWEAFRLMGPNMGPAGAITSTANDMARWMLMLLSGGENEAGEQVFSRDVTEQTRQPVNAYSVDLENLYKPPFTPVSYNEWTTYGLGLGQGSYRGYRAVAHYGNIFGHYTEFHLFPDLELGIYTSINGVQGPKNNAMKHIAMYVADIVLNEEPWLNATTACTFPEPFYPPTEASKPLHSLPIFPLRDPSVEKQSSSPISAKQREQFVGQYGNFLYGNLTVAIDDVTEELIMTSDLLSCVVRNVSGRVLCFGEGVFWFLILDDVQFDEQNVPSEHVDVLFSPVEGPTRFRRGLRADDAPRPTDDWPDCEPAKRVKIRRKKEVSNKEDSAE